MLTGPPGLNARLHGVAVWAESLLGLLAEASPDQRQDAWRRLGRQAVDTYGRLGGADGAKLQPPVALKARAGNLFVGRCRVPRLRTGGMSRLTEL